SQAPGKGSSARWLKGGRLLHRFPRGLLPGAERWIESALGRQIWSRARTLQTQLPNLALMTGLATAYFLAAKLGYSMVFSGGGTAAVWPPTGIGLAALLLLGYR